MPDHPIMPNAFVDFQPVPMPAAAWGAQAGFEIEENIPNAIRAILNIEKNKAGNKEPLKKNGTLGTDYFRAMSNGLFGIELEVEGKNLPNKFQKFWVSKADASLRGEALEYVLAEPLDLDKTKESLFYLNSKLTKPPTKLDFSFRTSMHVHINMRDFTKPQIQSFIYLSHILENVLVNYCDDKRVGNRFCLRTIDAEYKVNLIKNWLYATGFQKIEKDAVKYSAINISPLTSFGSIEFRSLQGTISLDVVFPWIDVLNNIKEIARVLPAIEISIQLEESPEEFCQLVFKEHYPLFYYDGIFDDIAECFNLFIEIPYIKC